MREIKLTLSKDGDKWCVLYGENLQEGHGEFDESISIAMNHMVIYLLENNLIEL